MSITPEEIKANRLKWIEALESGEYKQGRYQLCRHDEESVTKSFCCLGVAREVFGGVEEDACGHLLSTARFIFTPAERFSSVNETFEGTLIEMNDNQGYSFKAIASHLRKFWSLPKDETKPIGGSV